MNCERLKAVVVVIMLVQRTYFQINPVNSVANYEYLRYGFSFLFGSWETRKKISGLIKKSKLGQYVVEITLLQIV